MLPRDESAAYAIDDTILLARIVARYLDHPLETSFQIYESIRRSDITHAFKESLKLWERRNKDAGAFESWIRERLVPYQVRHTHRARKLAFEYNADKATIDIPACLMARNSSQYSLRPSLKTRSSFSSTDTFSSSNGTSHGYNSHDHSRRPSDVSGLMNSMTINEK